jgi:pimeloyl-ACP methyl ester carboxylesterase
MWPDVSRKIKREHRAGTLTGPLVVVGHSYGADDAVRLVRSLNDESIEVTVLALIDPTTPPRIPPNVRRCFNIYKSSPATDWIPVLRGIAVKADSDDTVLVNYDVRAHNDDGRFDYLDHFDIEESAAVQALVLEEVLRACPIRAERAADGGGAEPAGSASAAAGMLESSDG